MAKKKNKESKTDRRRDADVPGMPKGWRPGDLIVIPLREDEERLRIERSCDFSIPFWVGEPSR